MKKKFYFQKFENEGVCIDQLTDSEYQYLKPLLYMELVAIFDQYKIVKSYLKRKASKNKGKSLSCNFYTNSVEW